MPALIEEGVQVNLTWGGWPPRGKYDIESVVAFADWPIADLDPWFELQMSGHWRSLWRDLG
jgi:hypothetical protein